MACLRIGDTCPDFKSDSSIGEISLYEYLGDGWGVFFSHPGTLIQPLRPATPRVPLLFAEFPCLKQLKRFIWAMRKMNCGLT